MNKILVLHAHPRPDTSRVNAAMAVVSTRHPAVTFVDLYAEYPDFNINVDQEQQRLRDHNVIVWEHPFYWYSTPALLKEWQDLVLEHGFAYGTHGVALQNKIFLNVLSAGGVAESYTSTGANKQSVRALLAPIVQMAEMCRMQVLPPFVLYGAGHAAEQGRLPPHQQVYGRVLDVLADGTYDLEAVQAHETLNAALSAHTAAQHIKDVS